MNRDTSILLFVAVVATLFLPVPVAGQSHPPDRSLERQRVPATPFARDAADAHRAARPSRPITRRQKPATAASRRSGKKTKPTTTFWKTAGALAVIVVMILLAGRILKKRGGGIGNTLPAEAVELLGRRYLDQRQAIHLVRLGSRILVLGSSPDGLSSLAEITDPVEIDYLAGVCRPVSNSLGITQTFRSLFSGRQQIESDDNRSSRDDRETVSELNDAERFTADVSPQPSTELHHIPG